MLPELRLCCDGLRVFLGQRHQSILNLAILRVQFVHKLFPIFRPELLQGAVLLLHLHETALQAGDLQLGFLFHGENVVLGFGQFTECF